MVDEQAVKLRLDAEIARLKEHASTSTNACTAAKVIAVSDSRVPDLLLKKLLAGDVFRRVRCIARGAVLFELDCPPGEICLISPSFLVHVDLVRRIVTAISDPFEPSDSVATTKAIGTADAGFSRSAFDAPEAHTVKVTITGVTDRSAFIDGRKLSFGDGASAQTDVEAGDHTLRWAIAGEPGDKFTIKVEGLAKDIDASASIGPSGTEAGQFSFTIA